MSYPIQVISPHLVRAFNYIQATQNWLTPDQIAQGANISFSSASYLTLKLTREGILEMQAEHPPLRQYRLAKNYEQKELALKIAAAQQQLSSPIATSSKINGKTA